MTRKTMTALVSLVTLSGAVYGVCTLDLARVAVSLALTAAFLAWDHYSALADLCQADEISRSCQDDASREISQDFSCSYKSVLF